MQNDAENIVEDGPLDLCYFAFDLRAVLSATAQQHFENRENDRVADLQHCITLERPHRKGDDAARGGQSLDKFRKRKLLYRNKVYDDVRTQECGKAGPYRSGEVVVQQVNGTKLIVGDAIRSPEIISLSFADCLSFGRLTQIPEHIIDLVLRKNSIRHSNNIVIPRSKY